MRAEYWVIVALLLAVAEVLAPGAFLIFFALGALVAAAAALVFPSLAVQLGVLAAATVGALIAGNAFYRRLLSTRRANGLGRGPVGELGVVEDPIVGGRGKVRVRDISWLASGPDLPAGSPIVVVRKSGGTILVVAPRDPA
jgi:membrane protein implicated in regulation of membrane protease activity